MKEYTIFDSEELANQTVPVNTIRKIQLDGQQYCLAHTRQGWFVFEKECPHLSDDLSKGTLNHIPEVVCPWHSYAFNLVTGEEYRNRCAPLKVFNTKWQNGVLSVSMPH